ncbi:MAG: insulinase family protein [Holosporaceae bacterium]|jgi:zinc protease|nr:insulinase family protein [Holosporaceae bacterium]
MFQRSKIIIALLFIGLISVLIFLKKEESCIKINAIANNINIKAYRIHMKSNSVLYMKCKFKNAGVMHNDSSEHGISAIVGGLLCRKINGLSPEGTTEKLRSLGIGKLDVSAFGDDFTISFYVLKDKAEEALQFLAPVFSQIEFSKNDLEFIKERYPTVLELETAHPLKLLLEKLMSMLYQNHNYGRNSTGTAQAIASITEDNIREFLKLHFSKSKLEFLVVGDVSSFEVEGYLETLFSKLSKKIEETTEKKNELSSTTVSSEKDAIIHKKSMDNIVGVVSGIRIDDLSEKEIAAAYIIIETLFDNKVGDFVQGLREKNIAYSVGFNFLRRKFSNIFYFYVYVNKEDLVNFQEYLTQKMAQYEQEFFRGKDVHCVQNYMVAQSKNGFSNMMDLDEKIKRRSLPFSEVTQTVLMDTAKKLFNKLQLRTVYIFQ